MFFVVYAVVRCQFLANFSESCYSLCVFGYLYICLFVKSGIMATKVIYFTIGGHDEQTEFSVDDSVENVKELFRVAAEAREKDILKLYNVRGSLVNISPKLGENSPETRYRLEVVAALDSNEMFSFPAGFSLEDVESRLQALEKKILANSKDTSDEVQEVKVKVEALREKLEGLDHLSWLGLHKDLSRNTSLHPFWDKFTQELKSPEKFDHVWAKIEEFGDGQVPDEVCEYLKKLSFDNWQWDDSEMIILMQQMFLDLNLFAVLKIEKPLLTKWLFAVYKSYNDVPFHNFKHSFMVTQMMYSLIWLLDLKSKLDDVEMLTLIVSAICHDLDHPGYNNAYQINARTKLALLYNDISPLENHHCSVAFEILGNKNVNILANLEMDVYKRLREEMIRCILATDMAKHNDILKSFRAVIPPFDWNAREHRDLLLVVLLKLADISNEVRPLNVSNLWLECLLQEYFKQSDLEKLEGLPVAAFMDRDKVTKHSAQIGFIKFILLPLAEAIEEVFPFIREEIILPVHDSLEYYTQLQKEFEMEKLCSEDGKPIQNTHFIRPMEDVSRAVSDFEKGSLAHKFRIHQINKVSSIIAKVSTETM